MTGLPDLPHLIRHWRVDADHSNVVARWRELGGGAEWPDEKQWRVLADQDALESWSPAGGPPGGRRGRTHVELPMPAVSYWSWPRPDRRADWPCPSAAPSRG